MFVSEAWVYFSEQLVKKKELSLRTWRPLRLCKNINILFFIEKHKKFALKNQKKMHKKTKKIFVFNKIIKNTRKQKKSSFFIKIKITHKNCIKKTKKIFVFCNIIEKTKIFFVFYKKN